MTMLEAHHARPSTADSDCCDAQQPIEAPRQLGLVLGGGGGKGGAHLGVLAVLEALDVPIDIVVGTSVGALGVMYVAGLSLMELEQFFRDTELWRIAAADPLRAGLIGPRKRAALTARLLGDRTFADLPMPCAVVAADLVSGHEVVIDQGSLVPALLALRMAPGRSGTRALDSLPCHPGLRMTTPRPERSSASASPQVRLSPSSAPSVTMKMWSAHNGVSELHAEPSTLGGSHRQCEAYCGVRSRRARLRIDYAKGRRR
ncbi:MAG: patatin-like phospholipase family protein [Roseiflexaceae bacterium]